MLRRGQPMKSSASPRPVYRQTELNRVLNPQNVCIVGASPKTGSFGERVLTNLAGFGGNVYLVNSKYDRIGERRCYPSMAALPENPDCVAVVAPRDAVEDIVLQAARLRAGGAILYASGYAETRLPERMELQRRLGDIALETGFNIFGPNSLGIPNYLAPPPISFSDYP